MANIIKFEEKYSEQVYNLFMNVRDEEDFFKEFTYEEFCGHLFRSRAFNEEGTFIALEGEEVVGFASSMVRPSDDGNEKASCYLHTFFVKKEYRRQGIGSALLEKVEAYAKLMGRSSVRFVFVGGVNWPWYIPNTDHHMHPGMPCVRINSDLKDPIYILSIKFDTTYKDIALITINSDTFFIFNILSFKALKIYKYYRVL